jgi:hypothetical protein
VKFVCDVRGRGESVCWRLERDRQWCKSIQVSVDRKELMMEWECGKVCESRVEFFCQDDTNTDDYFNQSLLGQKIRQVPTRRIVKQRGFSLIVVGAITRVVWKTQENSTGVSGYNFHSLYTTGHADYMMHPCYIHVVSYCTLYPGCRHKWSM